MLLLLSLVCWFMIPDSRKHVCYRRFQVKKFDLKVASAGTVESFVQSSAAAQGGMEAKSVLGGQALLQKLEADLEALESHLVELNTYNERLTSEYNEKVRERARVGWA